MATVPTYEAPDYRELPDYNAPIYNEAEVDKLTQKRAAGGMRALRQAVSRAGASGYGNADVKRMTLRDALQGYGTGLSSVMAQAGATAAGEYGQQYARTSANKQAEWVSLAQKVTAENAYNRDVAKTQYASDFEAWKSQQEQSDWEKRLKMQDEISQKNWLRDYEIRRQPQPYTPRYVEEHPPRYTTIEGQPHKYRI